MYRFDDKLWVDLGDLAIRFVGCIIPVRLRSQLAGGRLGALSRDVAVLCRADSSYLSAVRCDNCAGSVLESVVGPHVGYHIRQPHERHRRIIINSTVPVTLTGRRRPKSLANAHHHLMITRSSARLAEVVRPLSTRHIINRFVATWHSSSFQLPPH